MLSAGSFTFSEDMQQFLETYGLLSFFLCFAYFSLSEIFLRGGTLGKLMFNITTAHSILGYPPPLGSILWRNAIKTLAIFSSSGIFLFFDILPFVLFPKRRMGHDWLSGTYAVTNKEAVTLLRKEDEKPTDDDFQI